ncbi:MAG TPA: tetratricopeptide repeat protein [Bdellovibrionales bacterium]|nr:tetratricopeptide repeat protein [Bdellovibrionales bacterium]
MKTLISAFTIFAVLGAAAPVQADETAGAYTIAQTKRVKKKKTARSTVRSSAKGVTAEGKELAKALSLARQGKYHEASTRLLKLSRDPRFMNERMQIKYILGLMLYEMKFNQVAAFQFVDVVREGTNKYIKNSLEKLAIVADQLGDDTLLNYALSRVNLEEFPAQNKDMLLFRIGEFQYRGGFFEKAADYLGRIPGTSIFYSEAKYLEGLALAEQNKPEQALKVFQSLLAANETAGVTDPNRVAALMSLARTHYQRKDWENAIDVYRQIPRDSEFWHDSLFEMSWAQMRSARFRSVLSNFHSLHSPYYEDFYLPESLLLRSIVYLYICQYDEMEKTLDLFDRIYQPVLKQTTDYVKANRDASKYYSELDNVIKNFGEFRRDAKKRSAIQLPFLVTRFVIREGDVQRTHKYISKLNEEYERLLQQPDVWKKSAIGRYVVKVLQGRMKAAKTRMGRQARNHMIRIVRDLRDLFEQHGYARFELLNAKKEALRKKMAGKGLAGPQVDEETSRSYYIQNGYEYWPFRGEYWLDEIGNYYYLGKSACE